MSATPPLPCAAPEAAMSGGRWMHELRNELNTAVMAAAAARHLLQAGATNEALENLRRTELACRRCAQLLHRERDPTG
jgi:C4-dicarboxylate-specific signal transduction histidine kinase